MTFDEANKIVEAFDKDPELEYWMPNSKVYEIIGKLREEYAPTVKLTQEQYDVLGELDIDIIKQVLLHPETINIVDE